MCTCLVYVCELMKQGNESYCTEKMTVNFNRCQPQLPAYNSLD